jgi:RNA polymerase sigma-70 factor (ECF subfamily)
LHNNNTDNSRIEIEAESLVGRAAEGDAGAFGRLYDIYADRIYRHIYYRTGNVEDARDMMQEVFVKAWKALPKYRKTKTPFLGWLYTISHNRVVDYYRTKKDYAYLNDEITVADTGTGPEDLAEARFTQQEVRKAILQLPEEQQRVIIMSFIDGIEYRQIAEALHKREGNIRVIVHRALKNMRKIMDTGK